jgi:hypothetical protein
MNIVSGHFPDSDISRLFIRSEVYLEPGAVFVPSMLAYFSLSFLVYLDAGGIDHERHVFLHGTDSDVHGQRLASKGQCGIVRGRT